MKDCKAVLHYWGEALTGGTWTRRVKQLVKRNLTVTLDCKQNPKTPWNKANICAYPLRDSTFKFFFVFTCPVDGVLVSRSVNATIQIYYCSALITILLLYIISHDPPISSASLFSPGFVVEDRCS